MIRTLHAFVFIFILAGEAFALPLQSGNPGLSFPLALDLAAQSTDPAMSTVTQNSSGTMTVNEDNVFDNLVGNFIAPGGAIVARNSRIIVRGDGIWNSGSAHGVGVKGDALYTGNGAYERLIGMEGAVQVTGKGTLDVGQGALSYVPTVAAGATMKQFLGYSLDIGSNNGTITKWVDFYSPLLKPAGKGTIETKYSLLNDDPDKLIVTQGRILYGKPGVRSEIAPAARLAYRQGRYYYGVRPSPGNASFKLLKSNIWFAPFYVASQATFAKIGCWVTTPQAGGLVALAIYATNAGSPANAPLAVTSPLDASSAGDKEGTISVTLNPGVYMLAVSGNSDALAVSGYMENAALELFGASTPSEDNVEVYSARGTETSWPTSPRFSYSTPTGNGNAPKIWLRPSS